MIDAQFIVDSLKRSLPEVKHIHVVPEKVVRGAAMTVRLRTGTEIYVNSALSKDAQLFALVHEFGHIALNELHSDPKSNWSEDLETRVNLWAVDYLSAYIPKDYAKVLREAFRRSEDLGFCMIERRLIQEIEGSAYANVEVK